VPAIGEEAKRTKNSGQHQCGNYAQLYTEHPQFCWATTLVILTQNVERPKNTTSGILQS
jgi:hypothetical protein